MGGVICQEKHHRWVAQSPKPASCAGVDVSGGAVAEAGSCAGVDVSGGAVAEAGKLCEVVVSGASPPASAIASAGGGARVACASTQIVVLMVPVRMLSTPVEE